MRGGRGGVRGGREDGDRPETTAGAYSALSPFFFLTNLQITHHPNSSGREKENRNQYSRTTVQEVSTLGRSFPLTNSAIKNSTKGRSFHTNLSSYADVVPLIVHQIQSVFITDTRSL